MANQTVTTTINYDDTLISGLLNGEQITINGGNLIINSDVRWNQQAAVFGNISFTATSKGSILFDARDVWEIPFDASTGNVPTQNALGSNGVTGGTSGATGELLRVWSASSLNPATAGGAMPATGYIKLRTKTGTFQDNEIITLPGGATVTVNSATGGKRSWIHAVGLQTGVLTAGRFADVKFLGDWYELGTTNGTDDQTFQFPVADFCPAIQIETAAGSGVYEWWMSAADRWGTATQFVSTDIRGKYFGINNTTGVITIARRATNPCGLKPPSGCKVRIPNLILSNSSSADWNANTCSATINDRYEFAVGGNAAIVAKYVSSTWYWFLTSPYLVEMEYVTTLRRMLIQDSVTTTSFKWVVIAPDANTNDTQFNFFRNYQSNLFENCKVGCSVNGTSQASYTIGECDNVTMTDCFGESFGNSGSDQYTSSMIAFNLANVNNATLTNCVGLGGRFRVSSSTNVVLTNSQFAQRLNGTSLANQVGTGINISISSRNCRINGFSNYGGLANVHPIGNVILIESAANNCIVENIGTYSSPYDCGTVNPPNVFVNAAISTFNCIYRNLYGINSGSTSLNLANSGFNNRFRNIGGQYAKNLNSIGGFNGNARGCGQASVTATAGQAGNHWSDIFTSETAGLIVAQANEVTSQSGISLVATLAATSGFTGGGACAMTSVGDQLLWETPYFILGHTGLVSVSGLIANVTTTFQWDIGSGWNGTWTALTNANLVAVGAIDPAIGIKLKIRAITNTASTANSISNISIITTSTASAQQILYPDDPDANGVIENLIAGSRIQVYNEDTNTELYNEVVSGTSYVYSYLNGSNISLGDMIRIRVAKLGYLPQTLIAIATATGFSAGANQSLDDVYTSNAIDGSTVTEFTADYPNVQIDISDPDQITTVQRIYAWIRYTETTNSGIAQWFDAIYASDDVNYGINASVLNLKLDNTQPTPVLIGGGRLFKSDGSSVISPTSFSIQMDPQRIYSTGGGSGGSLTAADVWNYGTRTLTSGAAPSAAAIASAVRTELATELSRIDVATSTRLATATYSLPPTSAQNAFAVRSELAVELGRIDVAISTRNAIAPDNASITAIKAKTDNLPAIPAARGDIPTAAQNASAVRSELNTELARIDVATSTRLATATYSSPPTALQNASAVRSELTVELGRIDVPISSRNSIAPDNTSITAIKAKTDNLPVIPAAKSDIPTSIQNASAVRTELNTELARIDANISSRSSTEPDNVSIAAIKSKTDNLPAVPAAKSDIPTTTQNAAAVRTELTTELNRLDVAISTRNATVPDNASIAAIKVKTDNLPTNPAAVTDIPSAAGNASAVRTELATELGRIDVAISTRNSVAPDNASITAIKTKTDNLPSDPASKGNVDEAIKAAKLAAAISASI
jgi:hypothetical protein